MIFSEQLIKDLTSRTFEIEVRIPSGYLKKLKFTLRGTKFIIQFGYNKELLHIVKSQFGGRKWDPDNKFWTCPADFRNLFRIEALRYGGQSPYRHWADYSDKMPLIIDHYKKHQVYSEEFEHQPEITALQYFNKWTLAAADMGLGKTLASIMTLKLIMEQHNNFTLSADNVVWVSPRACMNSTKLEFKKWGMPFIPTLTTYEGLKRLIAEWPDGKPAPRLLICDESTKCKTPTAKRTQAVQYMANAMRDEHDTEMWISLLSGTPAPKAPTDYFAQCEICCPGFISEGSIYAFRERLGVIEEAEGRTGTFKKVVEWREDEVKNLGPRLAGMVGIWFKEDCLNLPAKRYDTRTCRPSDDIINMAKLIRKTETRAIDVLTKLRMLSDGFQYKKVETDIKQRCPGCNGTGYQEVPKLSDPEEIIDSQTGEVLGLQESATEWVKETCLVCKGKLTINKQERQTIHIGSPKDELLREDLGRHEEVGRLVVYGGFQGTVDRITEVCQQEGWKVIRVDGRGWWTDLPITNETEMLRVFMEELVKHPKIVFVGQPGAAGMGLTLTASPTIIFFSNSFNSLDRRQTEDRGHRIGMSEHGGLIVDYVHLPTDLLVLKNLRDKKEIEMISMNAILEVFNDSVS